MAYAGTGTLPGNITYVLQSDNAATIQAKINSVQAGSSLVFESGTYDFGGATIEGKSGVTVWADGQVVINNAPGAGSGGAFDFSGQSDWTIGGNSPGNGFVFNGSLVNATNASGWTIGNSIFNNQQSNGYDGSAIRMNGASFGTIINNDFNGAGGNVIGMYNLNHITINGNHFVDSYEPIAIHSPTDGDTNFGNDIVIENNVFLGTQRAAIEIGPANPGTEHFSGLVINNNYFDNFNNTGGESWDTMLAISAVGQSSDNTTITNNYISRGPNDAGASGVAIEMTGTGEVSGNTIVNFGFAALAYQSGWNFHDNTVYNDGSSPYYGFANNGSGSGTFGSVSESSTLPADPPTPGRVAWGTEFAGEPGGGTVGQPSTPVTSPDPTAPDVGTPVPDTGTGPDTVAPVPDFTGATYSNGHVTLTGTSEPGSEVWVYEGLTRVGTAIAGSDGTWSMTGTDDGGAHHTYGAVAWDAAGNLGESAAYSPTASAQASPTAPPAASPVAPAVDTAAPDTGVLAPDVTAPVPIFTGATYSNGLVTLTGTSEAGSEVWVYEGETRVGTAIAAGDGTWSMTGIGDAGAHHTYGAVAWDPAGNFGQSSSYNPTATAQASTAAPAASSGGATAPAPDTVAPVPNFTEATYSNGHVTLTGTSEAGSEVWVYEGENRIGTAIAGSDGTWSMTGIGDAGTVHNYGAVAWDQAGNLGQSGNYTADATVQLVGIIPVATA
jgi:hypothetical protein